MSDGGRPKDKLLKRLGTAGLVAASLLGQVAAARPAVPSTQSEASETIPQGLDRFQAILAHNDVTVLGSIHREEAESFAWLNASFDRIKSAGIRTLSIEQPSVFQHTSDAYADAVRLGTPSGIQVREKDFLNKLKTITPFFLPAGKVDIFRSEIIGLAKKSASADIGMVLTSIENDPVAESIIVDESGKFDKLADVTKNGKNLTGRRARDLATQIVKETAELAAVDFSQKGTAAILKPVLDTANARGGKLLISIGAGHAVPIQQNLSTTDKKVAIIFVHSSEADYRRDIADFPSIPFSRFNNFITDQNRFIDDPAPSPTTSPAQPAAKARVPAAHR